jgi:predicted dithiol-disulfide oxidoreductase (DUF899 family)
VAIAVVLQDRRSGREPSPRRGLAQRERHLGLGHDAARPCDPLVLAEASAGTTQEIAGTHEIAELRHRDAAQGETRRIVAERDALQRAERITACERPRGCVDRRVQSDARIAALSPCESRRRCYSPMRDEGATPLAMTTHEITTRENWLRARLALLAQEKEHVRQEERLAEARRNLPWVRVEKPYTFEGPDGRASLADVFVGRSQLVVYHFMFGPESKAPCKSCSFWADHFDAMTPHLAARDVTLAVISRAPRERFAEFQRRMGWRFPWYSAFASDFNTDFAVSFEPEQVGRERVYNFGMNEPEAREKQGISVFAKDEHGAVFHTYSSYARGAEMANGTYHILDLVPKGRDEAGLSFPMAWVRYHDEYGR